MKLGKGLLLVLALTLGVGSAFAQSIDMVGDPAGTTCSGTLMPGTTPFLYIIARQGPNAPDGITGAEFWVSGFPATWLSIVTPNPASAVALGSPFATTPPFRANIAFPACQPWSGNGIIPLYTIQVIPLSVVGETYLQVQIANPPSNIDYTGPIVTLCDPPIFTAVVVDGGTFIMNGRPCTVSVEEKTWSQVKALY